MPDEDMPLNPEGGYKNGSDSLPKQTLDLLKNIQSIVATVVGLTALLTGSGFLIVNNYLAKYTKIHGFDINVGQYLAAGVGFLLVIVLAAMITLGVSRLISFINPGKTTEILLRVLLYVILVYIVALILGVKIDVQYLSPAAALLGFLSSFIGPILSKAGTAIWENTSDKWKVAIREHSQGYIRFAIFFVLGLGGTYLYSQFVYGNLPHYFGGGAPEPIILSFADEQTAKSLGLTFEVGEPRRTQTVLMLAELADGLLIADTNNGRVVEVRNNEVNGRMDQATLEWVITPTLMPTAIGTATPSQSPASSTQSSP